MWVCGSLFIVIRRESWPVCSWWKGWEWHVDRRPRQCLSIDPWGSQCLARYGSPLRWKPVDITHIIRTILSSYHLLRYGAGRFVRSQLDIVSYTSCSWLWSVFTHISMFEIVNVSSNNPRLNSVSCLRLERHTCGVTGNGGRGVARNRSAARLATPTWQHCATAVWLKRELSVGTKWRPCVIDTVNFLSKMSVSVMCLVVGPPERCPVTGRALGKPGLYVRIPEIQT